MKQRRVLIIAAAPAQLLDLAGPAEVFSQAGRMLAARHDYDVKTVVLPDPSNVGGPSTTAGVRLESGASLPELLADPRPLDTLIVGGGEGARRGADDRTLRDGVRVLANRSRRVASVCTGAFVLAAAGLLDGKRAVTHWRHCDQLARSFPAIRVDPDPIFIRDGQTWTSAGVTAGIDLALALVEEDHGHALALAVARELVMFLRRPGGQGQFSATLAAQSSTHTNLSDLVPWIADNLHRPLTVEALAARACLSPRQFARVFAREFGVPPAKMVERMRVEAARQRLEEQPRGLSSVAADCGFGTDETMRRAFLRHLGAAPGAYRDRFRRNPTQDTHA